MDRAGESLDPGVEWGTVQEALPIRFAGEFDTREHYEEVRDCWTTAEAYREAVDGLLEGTDADREARRAAAAAAGQELMGELGEASYGLSKLCDVVYGLFRALDEGRAVVSSEAGLSDDEMIDAVRGWFGWVGEEMYVPSVQGAMYREDELFDDRTLIERTWIAEEDRVARNRLDQGLDTIVSEAGAFDLEYRQWAESLQQRLVTVE